MILQPSELEYYGRSSGATNYITASMTRSAGSKIWTIQIRLHGLRIPPEAFAFLPFFVDTTQPFDTGLQRWELLPNPGHSDFREARFSS